jgi:hypothetical protein
VDRREEPVCASLSIKFSSRYTFSHFGGCVESKRGSRVCIGVDESSLMKTRSKRWQRKREGSCVSLCVEMTTSFDVSSSSSLDKGDIPPTRVECTTTPSQDSLASAFRLD